MSICRVTPSRVCELKSALFVSKHLTNGHTLTGVWVEMKFHQSKQSHQLSHPHGCVSWNMSCGIPAERNSVTPSRVCELKFLTTGISNFFNLSHPHGCVSWNYAIIGNGGALGSHTLTGVWVEINYNFTIKMPLRVTPSRVCELKFQTTRNRKPPISHTLTGVWVEIPGVFLWEISVAVTPSRVCELKCAFF